MAATKRSQNKCVDCKYTWYPKGKDLSARCPKCASVNVKYAGMGLLGQFGLGVVVIAGMLIFSGKDKTSTEPVSNEAMPQKALDTLKQATPEIEIPASHGIKSERSQDQVEYGENKAVMTSLPVNQSNISQISHTPVSADRENIYSEYEIEQMEIEKQYQGDDPIIRRRLQLPSRETGKLIP